MLIEFVYSIPSRDRKEAREQCGARTARGSAPLKTLVQITNSVRVACGTVPLRGKQSRLK
jgi:hypothetical protein